MYNRKCVFNKVGKIITSAIMQITQVNGSWYSNLFTWNSKVLGHQWNILLDQQITQANGSWYRKKIMGVNPLNYLKLIKQIW